MCCLAVYILLFLSVNAHAVVVLQMIWMQEGRRGKSDTKQEHRGAAEEQWRSNRRTSGLVPPMQFPHFEESREQATAASVEQDVGSNHIVKHSKLQRKSSTIKHTHSNASSSSSSSSRFPSLQILEARRNLMKEICAKYKGSISRTVTRHHVQHLYVEDKYKLLYCQVPKVGCSNWKRTLMVLAGRATSASTIKHDTVHYGKHLKTLDSFDCQGIMHRLETYTKVMFVREPLERIVSAFRDKFENPNPHYHSLLGRPIISKYRLNASQEALLTGNGVTFKEFVQYLLDVHRPVGMDIHWEQMNQLCNPCLIDYDFIGKFENMEEESNIVLRLTGAPANVTLPNFKDRNPTDERTTVDIMQKYFSQVSLQERQRVYDFYYMDYLMFNYSKPFKDLY